MTIEHLAFNKRVADLVKQNNDATIQYILQYMNMRKITDYYRVFDDIGFKVGLSFYATPIREPGRRKDSYQVWFDFKPGHLIAGEREGLEKIQIWNTDKEAHKYMAKEVYYRFMNVDNLGTLLASGRTYRDKNTEK